MAYQETTKINYGQRLSGSLKGIGGGLILLIAGTVLLFWNEGNFVKTKKSINEAQSVVVKAKNVNSPNPELDGKLIYGVAKAQTEDFLTDELFDISVNAVKLSRAVEYYQWVEHQKTETRDKIGGGQEKVTTYTYRKEWVKSPVNSAKFKDPEYQSANTIIVDIENKEQVADRVTWGVYELPSFLKNAISGITPAAIQLGSQGKAEWEKALQPVTPATTDTAKAVSKEYLHISGNTAYFGANHSVPSVGDMRITITYTPPGGDLSVIAQVQGNTFTKYTTKSGKEFSSVKNGIVSAEQMFEGEHKANSIWSWILRVVGLFLIIGGLKSVFGILPALFKVLPFLGNIVGAGVGLVCSVFGFAWSLIIIAIAWLFYRPLIAALFLLIAGAGIWFLKEKAKERKAKAGETGA